MMANPGAALEPTSFTTDDGHGRPISPTSTAWAPYPDDADTDTDRAPAWSNWALSRELQEMCGPRIRRSLRGSFDRSVVVWHIATDLCFRTDPNNPPAAASSGSGGHPPWCCPPLFQQAGQGRAGAAALGAYHEVLGNRMNCAASISDYMAHLLNSHPEMLLTGSRQHLVTEAIREMEHILHDMHKGDSRAGQQTSTEVLNRIIDVYSEWTPASRKLRISRNRSKQQVLPGAAAAEEVEVSLFHIPQSCRVAKELREIEDAEVRWHLMYRVWLGMLCYSASMCRGYLHAKSLGEDGEFLSYLWLVLSLRGAKTLADKLQMPEEDDDDDHDDDHDELLADDDGTPDQNQEHRF